MRTRREGILLNVLAIVAAIGAWCALMSNSDLSWPIMLVSAWACERESVWSERRKRIAAEAHTSDVVATAARMVLKAAWGAEVAVYSPGCECQACAVKRGFKDGRGGLPS